MLPLKMEVQYFAENPPGSRRTFWRGCDCFWGKQHGKILPGTLLLLLSLSSWSSSSWLLLLLVETKTAAQHSCHMLQVRDFNGILLGIGSKVWRDVSSWTSCCCSTRVLVGLLLVFCCVVWGGGQKTTTGLQILFLGGVETTTSFGRGGSKKQPRGCSFCF